MSYGDCDEKQPGFFMTIFGSLVVGSVVAIFFAGLMVFAEGCDRMLGLG